MIDGVKILCNLNPTDWTNNKNLSFRSWIDEATGEIPNNSKHANINGLHLSIIQSEKDTFCNVRGSLPKYYTNGETNANDYDFNDFLNTCDKLENGLNISPNSATLRGFEFGVNINLPFEFSNIYESVKSYMQHAPKTNTKTQGILFDFQQYQIKIYDKGLQETGKKSRLMRFEISINKMIWIKKLGIKTLADLQNISLWAEFSKILLKVWNEIIFIDKSLNYKVMTNHEQKKYLYYFDVNYWANLNKKQYFTAKNHLNKLQYLYHGKSNSKEIIYDLIANKCQLLATESNKRKGNDLTKTQDLKSTFENPENLQRSKNTNRVLFNPLDERLKELLFTPHLLTGSKTKNIRQNNKPKTKEKKAKKSKCMNCKTPLNKKSPNIKFCGLKCKNQYNGRKRTKANQQKRIQEIKALKKILAKLPETNLGLLVLYKSDGLQYADHLHQKEINPPPHWIRQIKKVLITDNKTAPPLEFTTIRAKQLIREITKINLKNILQ